MESLRAQEVGHTVTQKTSKSLRIAEQIVLREKKSNFTNNSIFCTGGQGQNFQRGVGCKFFPPRGVTPPPQPIFLPAALVSIPRNNFHYIPVGNVNSKCAAGEIFTNGVLKVQN